MSEVRPIRVFIADDHPILRIGLSMYLEKSNRIRIVGEAENGFEAVKGISADPPDVVLMDIDMPGLSGVEAIRLLRKTIPDLLIIVLSTYTKKEYIQEAMSEGREHALDARLGKSQLARQRAVGQPARAQAALERVDEAAAHGHAPYGIR